VIVNIGGDPPRPGRQPLSAAQSIVPEDHMSRTARRRRLVAVGALAVISIGSVAVAQLPASAASTVSVNGATTYQVIDGFGASQAFGMADVIRNSNATLRKQALDLLFSPTTGAGFSILRNIIPSDASHTIEPKGPGSPSAAPTYVWNAGNDATDWGQLWLAKQAKAYGVTNFYNDAWSAPAFMKTNNNETGGGQLCGTPGASCASGDWRQAYANYLVQHEKYWTEAGVPSSELGFVNEPSYTTNYSSMLVNAAQATDFLKVLGPTVKAAGLSTKITCCETLGWGLLPSYVNATSADAAASSAVGVYTSHGYSGGPNSRIDTKGKPVWQTEWSQGTGTNDPNWDSGAATSGLSWAQNIHNGLANANLNAFLYWWGISSFSDGNSALAFISNNSLTATKRFYAFANYSRFIRPGAMRIGATSGDTNLKVTAFKNIDGSVAVAVLNTGQSSISTSYAIANAGVTTGTATPYLTNNGSSTSAQAPISVSGGAFSATVPARSLVTYKVTGSGVPVPTTTVPTTTVPTTTASTTSAPATSLCTVGYTTSTWNTGLTAAITITNTGAAALNGWTLGFTLPAGQTIVSGWNATYAPTSGAVKATNAAYNGSIPSGGSASIGFQASHTGNTASPSGFTLDGKSCTVA
jgi:glucuronoarabinoxylan endo-1,4-beta-xylanase